MALSREEILATKAPRESVPWSNGGTVIVQAMGCAERDAFEKSSMQLSSASDDELAHLNNFRARLLVHCLVDESGNRLFAPEDADELGRCWCAPLDKAFEASKRLCGYTDADIEELVKNSVGAPNDSTGTT